MSPTPSRTPRPRACRALFIAALALAAPRAAVAQEVPISESARTHFSAGVRLLQDPGGARYEEAYQEFKVAYGDSPSPRILGNVGLCAMKLERDEEAIRSFELYLAGAPKIDPAERKQIESDLRTLRASLVHLTLALTTSDVRVTDVRTPVQGPLVTNTYGPLPAGSAQLGIHPGHHVITVKREGYTPISWEIDALPSASLSHPFTLQPLTPARDPVVAPPPPRVIEPLPPPAPLRPSVLPAPVDEGPSRPTPASVWALTGVTVAFGIAGTVTGALAVSKRDAYDTINDGTRIPDAQSLRSAGQTLNVATDVLFGTAIAGAVVTIIVYATRPKAPVQPVAARGISLAF
jgi:hypothetical protein